MPNQEVVTMKRLIVISLLAVTVLISQAAFGAQVSIGIRIGPPPPPVVRVYPVQPGPEFVWIGGYWYPVAHHWRWHEGYWTRSPYPGAYWYGPRYEGGAYLEGYWEGGYGRIIHSHKWDRDRERDY